MRRAKKRTLEESQMQAGESILKEPWFIHSCIYSTAHLSAPLSHSFPFLSLHNFVSDLISLSQVCLSSPNVSVMASTSEYNALCTPTHPSRDGDTSACCLLVGSPTSHLEQEGCLKLCGAAICADIVAY